MPRDDNEEAGVADADVGVEEYEDDKQRATQTDLGLEKQKSDANQLTARDKKPRSRWRPWR